VASCERFVEEQRDRPHVARCARVVAVQALGRDVRERARHVADRGQRLRVGEAREPEVEEAHRDATRPFREQDVRRLDVAVDDPAPVRVRERVEHLRRRLDRVGVIDFAGAQRLAERAPADVLVRDVDVLRVAAARECAQAAAVVQLRHRLRLAARAGAGLPLPRDDLDRHLAPGPHVLGEPDRAGAAAPERAQGPVAPEEEAWLRVEREGFGQRPKCLCHGRTNSFPGRSSG
jgi:hypothetical protein